MGFWIESIKGVAGEDAKYGIITVEPNRAIKKCRIRKLRIGYFLTRVVVIPIVPQSCESCSCFFDCIEDFAGQIVEKYAARLK